MQRRFVYCFFMTLFLATGALAQQTEIRGNVVDSATNEPVAGASITVSQTGYGTTSDNSGRFLLKAPAGTKWIQVSFLNYETRTVPVENAPSPLVIKLLRDDKSLDEVVVVGYGTQKKRDLTGAVSTVSAKDVGGRQTVQVSEALQGAIAGVSVTRNSAAPGGGATINIRGITTIGANSPLIIVDGVPAASIDLVNPNDVESLSVLKDASSAAIYGSRGAAGVILITTKRGKTGQASLDYNYEYGVQQPTALPEYVGVQDYFRYYNESLVNAGGNPLRSEDYINSYLDSNRVNPDKFPNTDWQKAILRPTAPRVRHDLVFTAGTEKLKTKASFGYQKTGAFYDNYDYERFQIRINNDLQINKKLAANLDMAFRRTNSDATLYNPISDSRVYPAWYDDYYDDGRFAPGKDGTNPVAQVLNGGTRRERLNQLSGRFGLQFKPLQGLTVSGMIAPIYDFDKRKDFSKPLSYTDKNDPSRIIGRSATPRAVLTESRNENFTLNGQFLINYNREIGQGHTIDVLAGYEENYNQYETMGAARTGFPLLDYPYLNSGSKEIMENSGSAREYTLRSFFGRLQYNFQDKYYVQGNLRADQSSRFAASYRNAVFPSVSAGWTVSREAFMKDIAWLDFLKIRGSWGEAGNERLTDGPPNYNQVYYPYQATLDFTNALFYQNGAVIPLSGAGQQTYAIHDISWETTRSANIGLDAAFLNNRLSLVAEYYNKKTIDILLPLDIPLYVGYERPNQNAGVLNVKGWEAELSWRDHIGRFNYTAGVNLSDAKSKIGDLKGTQFLGDQVIRSGSEYNEWFGYRTKGLFQTAEEVANAPVHNNNIKPGDIKYVDINQDGRITPDDRVLLGGALPRYQYGGYMRGDYNGFDMNIAFQGVGKQLSRMNADVIRPFAAGFGNFPVDMVGKFWSTNNTAEQNAQAIYPRLVSAVELNNNNYLLSDHWLMNGAYFRLKNITLGYTLRQQFLKRAGVQRLRFYVAVNDLFALSKFPKYVDPESGNSAYPIVRTWMVGASIRF
ncbi:SusC/RagA family TonB-linked outer membrane protein [Niabella hirudinis]|uniref:SusC/RagA family TonB-linked outer membrane protein n=1 Tax=Niabella hirudinis TaxID=1285929 RepID=UPI003EB920D2